MTGIVIRLTGLATVFTLSLLSLYLLWLNSPVLSNGIEKPNRFPRSIEEVKGIATVLATFRSENFLYTMTFFSTAYLFKQTFAIPGSFFLNILAGALFGRVIGSIIVCTLTALGASLCYLLSYQIGGSHVEEHFSERIGYLREMVHENDHRLLYFLLGARLFPFTPQWLLNMLSPFLDIPLSTFALSVLIGLAPYNMICVHAGGTLAQIDKMSDVINTPVLLQLLILAISIGGYAMSQRKVPHD